MSRKRIENNFLNHPTLNKCIEAIEIQVILIKKVLSIDFIDEATWHVINGPNYTQSTDGAVYVPDIGIKSSAIQFAFILVLVFYVTKILVEETGIS